VQEQIMTVLEIEGVSKSFGKVQAVRNINFSVETGRIYGVLGPNGAGKTTTIRMIMNILLPDSGQIRLFGQSMEDGLKRRIGYLPEERGLYAKMKVLDMLVFLGELHELSPGVAVARSREWLKRVELDSWEQKKVEDLSKGMQQKVQFIGTIMHQPDLIILDEPFAGLDPINTQMMKNIMLELKADNRAIMFSTHLMEVAEKICDDILLIDKGEKVLDGDLVSIKKQYGSNAIQLEYDGDIQFLNKLDLIEKIDDYGNYVEIRLRKECSAKQLLRALIDRIEVRRFQSTESSLNDIFIEVVGRKSNV
jgi:ABC-2 type transport system ATP-binding protein